jgi:hypothetical protein
MPGYGIVEATEGDGLLPWAWAVDHLVASHNYWLATSRADGRPHCMPIWGVWIDGVFCFSTGAASAKARNLASNARCVVTTERADDAVIVEGTATLASDGEFLTRAGQLYAAKYPPYKLDPSMGPILVVKPSIAFGFIELKMTNTATRWIFR